MTDQVVPLGDRSRTRREFLAGWCRKVDDSALIFPLRIGRWGNELADIAYVVRSANLAWSAQADAPRSCLAGFSGAR